MKKTASWQTKSFKILYESKFLKLVHNEVIRPDGSPGTYDVVERKDFVLIIPKHKQGFVLVEQYRFPVKSQSWEFPKGIVESKEKEMVAAKRELEEESSFKTKKITKLGHLWVGNGFTNMGYHVFLAEELIPGNQKLDNTEQDMVSQIISFEKLKQMIKKGVIKDSPTVAAFGLYLLRNSQT